MTNPAAASTYRVWGWGEPADEPTPAALTAARPMLAARLGFALAEPEQPAALAELPADRVSRLLPGALAGLASADPLDRAAHGLGRSYPDLVRGIRGRPDHVPDVVVRPRDEADILALLEAAADARWAVIPFGGGTSVVGGVEPVVGAGWAGVLALDLELLQGVRELDPVSRAARVGAGTRGGELERQLAAHGLTARFFPQSFERSTVGGWVATRAAGHFATRLTHVDDLVESVRAVTPVGVWESRRLPGSGAGPSPDRMLLGSEGSLGVITEAWLRVQPRPRHRWSAVLAAPDFPTGAAAVRELLHEGLLPAACRVVDAAEATLTGLLTTGEAALVLGLESTGDPLTESAGHALAVCADAGLRLVESGSRESSGGSGGAGSGGAGGAWRATFLRAPYLREQLVLLGVLTDTFETAVTWDRLPALIAGVRSAVGSALQRVCGAGLLTCRITHAYVDGAAPYFTILAPARRGSELAQWRELKAAASDAVLAQGGTITHHHAVGRDHLPWYEAQRPEPFARALAAAKAAVDPAGILNPGVLGLR